ncbi:MAG: CoA transferase subunit A [Acidimicrobiia bacterium]|nr:CoA transferase subunit A [Acidimicrobiia bacterium]
MSAEDVAARVRSGMTVGIGGWGSRRKPMTLVRELLRTDVDDLTVVAYGGPDVGLLCAAGKVRKVVSGFVSLDSIPLEPHYRAARQGGTIEAAEWDEGMLLLGLQAAAWRVPFLPTRAGLGSDVLALHPDLRTVRSPYVDGDGAGGDQPEGQLGEELVAVPALDLDVALLHVHRADRAGNSALLGPDPYMDDLFAAAATETYVSCEQVVATEELARLAPLPALSLSRLQVTGVVEAPGGAAFTECPPDYPRDEALQRRYVEAASEPDGWRTFLDEWAAGTSGAPETGGNHG